MASMTHEGLVTLFRNHPALAAELLQGPLGLELPAWNEVRVVPGDFPQVVNPEYQADLIVLLENGTPVLAIIVEVQLSQDPDKRERWPVYLTNLRAREHCPVVLLVVAPDEAVARWCAKPIEMGHPFFVLQPLVVGPKAIPQLLGPQAVGVSPEMAVLSALAHGHQEELSPALFEAVVTSTQGLDIERYGFYVDLALSAFSPAARKALEAMMRSGTYEYQTELVRNFMARAKEERQEGLKEGFKEGQQVGRLEGQQVGRLEGQQVGRLEGERRALLKVLEARGLKVEAATRRRLLAAKDLKQLECWLGHAVRVRSVQELFKYKPASPLQASTVSAPTKVRNPRAKG